ncbi:methionyl-tRNA formyltransferase, mitochondrial [Drosophila grimshawi]|uniref:Methionyl-tRNA formyltransferase, mitochondrial n=1 Tax=Drosophila grimshawi TaxID=7222 RepID=B4JI21_DROGR|nr:methionyl-tRNA formyltransferase, mitochondrial [Drosophila grimshawi]EDV93941.1 GH19599 [Drosophila grimshawi]
MLCGKSLANNFFKYKRKVYGNIWQSSRRCKITHQSPKVLFFGTDNFSLPSLTKLHQSKVDVAVVTSFKSPANCVRSYADKHKLPLYRWPITAEQCTPFELGIVVSFGHLIPLHIINALPRGIINVHASLLPRWRGAAPIIYAIMNGDAKTGISIMQIQPHRFDIGPILNQREISLRSDIFLPELHSTLSQLGAELLVDTVHHLEERLSKVTPQDETLATYAPKITPQITEIVWSHQTALEIFARHRALYGFKHLSTSFEERQIQLLELKQHEREWDRAAAPTAALAPGCFCFNRLRRSLIIGCAGGTQLELKQLRLEGRRPMSAQDFNNGYLKRAQSRQFTQNKQIAIY